MEVERPPLGRAEFRQRDLDSVLGAEDPEVVSEKHANFIIAQKGCKSDDVIKLIDKVRQTVKEKLGIELELEIEIWK
jgi:UDP-N-acetylenolpyruvoylglucosamine reductase